MKSKGLKVSSNIFKKALAEDIGKKDITTASLIPKRKKISAVILAKEKQAVICGLSVAGDVFKLQDKQITFKSRFKDGQLIKKSDNVAEIFGPAHSILTAERVALNFLSLLSGIATKTRKFVDKIRPYKVKIMDTRKTYPGLRGLEKYAVRIGGGYNHRFKLDEMFLIKDNHLKIIGGIDKLRGFAKRYKVEIEVKNLREFKTALRLNPDIIMLDNMKATDMKKAARLRKATKPKLEASGNISLNNVREIAATGVDFISVGELTHSTQAVDFSLKVF